MFFEPIRQSALGFGFPPQQGQQACVKKMAHGHFLHFGGGIPIRLGEGGDGLVSIIKVCAPNTVGMLGLIALHILAPAESQVKKARKGSFRVHCLPAFRERNAGK